MGFGLTRGRKMMLLQWPHDFAAYSVRPPGTSGSKIVSELSEFIDGYFDGVGTFDLGLKHHIRDHILALNDKR